MFLTWCTLLLGVGLAQRDAGQASGVPCEVDCVLHEHRDGHRADAARHRRDRARHQLRALEVHVTTEHVAARVLWCGL